MITTLDVGEEIYEIYGRPCGLDLDGMVKIGDRDNEGKSAGIYGTSFAVGVFGRCRSQG